MGKNKTLLESIIVLGYGAGVAAIGVLYYTFLMAYNNGMETVVKVNTIGEANIEYIMLPIFLIIGIIGWVALIKRGKIKS